MKNHEFMNLIVNFFREVADLIYPPKCLICGNFKGSDFCDECYDMINIDDLKKIKLNYIDDVYIIGKYEGVLEKGIRLLKFHNRIIISEYLGKLLAEKIVGLDINYNDAIFVPIPLNQKRIKERGFNQSRKILEKAKNILPNTNIIDEGIFVRIKNTAHFFDLNEIERREEIKDAFKIMDKDYLENKNIILFDDILTTGSTLMEAARVLRLDGVGKIFAIVLSKA